MALINCKECGKEISDRASNCIYCGCPICKEEDSTGKFDNTGNHGDVSSRTRIRKTKLKFYQKSWFIILMLIVLFPVGLVLMWKNRKFHAAVRVILSVIWCAHFMFWSMMFIGLLLPCDHVWTEATASDPKTCLICGETEGEPLFYEEDTSGDDKNLDGNIEKETAQTPMSAEFRELISYINNGEFTFTPDEFTSNLDNCLKSVDGNYGAYIGVRDEDNVVSVCIYRVSNSSGVCHIIFMNDDEEFKYESARSKSGIDTLGFIFDDSCSDEELANLLPAILQSVNPSLSAIEAADATVRIIGDAEYNCTKEDEITYVLIDVEDIENEGNSKWWLYIFLEE